jgi:hypothetical protein
VLLNIPPLLWALKSLSALYPHPIFFTTINLSKSFWCCKSQGVSAAVLGPTFPDLARNVNRNVSSLSEIFVGRALGYLCGSVVGGVLFDCMNHFLLLGKITVVFTPLFLLLSLQFVSEYEVVYLACNLAYLVIARRCGQSKYYYVLFSPTTTALPESTVPCQWQGPTNPVERVLAIPSLVSLHRNSGSIPGACWPQEWCLSEAAGFLELKRLETSALEIWIGHKGGQKVDGYWGLCFCLGLVFSSQVRKLSY